jgi:hypothetical protein
MSRHEDRGPSRVRIPADVERPDKLLAGLTARQLAILGAAGVALWAGYAATRHVLPLPLYGAVAFPIGAMAAALALGRLEGVAADRWVSFAWRHHRSPHRLVPAPDGVPAVPAFLGADPEPLPQPLRLPLAGVSAEGIIDLGAEGMAVTCRASAVTFSLRTPAEQEALVAGFARWLNSLDRPAQLLVRAEPIDLGPTIDALLAAAPGLAHPALEAAARDHASFLGDLARRRDLLRREVLVVLHQASSPDAPSRLARRAEAAASALSSAGVTLVPLDGPSTATSLAGALDPAGDPRPEGLDGPSLYDATMPVTLARGGDFA